jgi:hypothetical protein
MEGSDGLASLIRKPLERIWNALTNEKIKELEIQGVIKVFERSLENKQWIVKEGKAEIPIADLEQEPRIAASELVDVLKNLKKLG